jgi:hypothetical protein
MNTIKRGKSDLCRIAKSARWWLDSPKNYYHINFLTSISSIDMCGQLGWSMQYTSYVINQTTQYIFCVQVQIQEVCHRGCTRVYRVWISSFKTNFWIRKSNQAPCVLCFFFFFSVWVRFGVKQRTFGFLERASIQALAYQQTNIELNKKRTIKK